MRVAHLIRNTPEKSIYALGEPENIEAHFVKYWNYFWMANFVVAGSTFVIITLVVLVHGIGELREMFTGLRRQSESFEACAEHQAVAIRPQDSQDNK